MKITTPTIRVCDHDLVAGASSYRILVSRPTVARSPRYAMRLTLLWMAWVLAPAALLVADEPVLQKFTHRITGLSCPERTKDLIDCFQEQKLASVAEIDFAKAQAVFTYDPKQVSTESLGHMLGTKGFGVKPPATMPLEEYIRLEIRVVGLDCKGCSLGTYNAIYRIEGVEQATASYKQGLVIAWIDPRKTTREALETALKNAGVTLQSMVEAKPN